MSDTTPRRELGWIARGGTLNLAGYVTAGALGFVLTFIITRELGAAGAGVVFSGVAVFTILANVTELGADTGVVRFVARFRELARDGDVRRVIAVAIVPAAVAGLLAAIVMFWRADAFASIFAKGSPAEVARMLRLLSPFLPLATISTVALAATRGFGSMRAFVAVEGVGKPAIRPVLVLILSIGGLSYAGVAFGWGFPEVLGCVAALLMLARMVPENERVTRPPRSVLSLAREFWAFSAPRGVAAAFQVSVIWFDVLLLGRYRPSADVGIYAAASRVASMGTYALQAVRLAIAPQLSAMLAREDREGAEDIYQTSTWWLMAVSWPLFLTLIAFGPLVLSAFGPGFERGARALAIVSIGMLVNLGTGNVTVVLLMGGKSSWNLLNTAVALALNVALNVALIPRYGMEGAGLAWAISIAVDNLLALIEVRAFLGMRPFGPGYPPAAVGPLLCFGLTGIAARAWLGPTLEGFVLFAIVAGASYGWFLVRYGRALRLDQLIGALRRRSGVSG